MTELRQKMIRAMELKNLSDHTQKAYLAAVTGIAKFYDQSPDKMTQEKIEDYLLYLKQDKGIAPNSCYSVLTGLRFFYKHVTEKEIPVTYSIRRTPRKLPEVLSMQDIWKIICSANNLKHNGMAVPHQSRHIFAYDKTTGKKAWEVRLEGTVTPTATSRMAPVCGPRRRSWKNSTPTTTPSCCKPQRASA